MSIYQTLVCDRCGKEQKSEDSYSWNGWRRSAHVQLQEIAALYSGTPDFNWHGDLCSSCAGDVDASVRMLFGPRQAPNGQPHNGEQGS